MIVSSCETGFLTGVLSVFSQGLTAGAQCIVIIITYC